jgi:hemerythrin-like metal-binding protein
MHSDELSPPGALRIDNEHATLSRMLERLAAICVIANAEACATACPLGWQDNCSSDLESVVAALTAYMHDHFHYEEEQMDECVVEEQFLEHRNEHRKIAAQVESIIDRHRRAELDPMATAAILADTLSRWLQDHIENYDEVLTVFLDGGSSDQNLID